HCGLAAVIGKRIHECSKGYRQRVGLAAALLHDPRVVVLDEPTHGLDPLQVAAFRDFVKGLSPGRAILFSSHILAEVVAISQRLLVIESGRLVADVPIAELSTRAKDRGTDLEAVVLDLVRSRSAGPAS